MAASLCIIWVLLGLMALAISIQGFSGQLHAWRPQPFGVLKEET
jgi:hypothetical protein